MILLFLTVVTVLVAKPVSGFDAGFLNVFIAFFIATVKASFVGAFFMQLKYENKLYLVIILSGVFFLLTIFGFVGFDVATRVIEVSPL